jgi:probable addiction module antidote protein
MVRKTRTNRYDVAERLRTREEMAAYLEACLEEAGGDAAFIAKALGDIARAKGVAQVAANSSIERCRAAKPAQFAQFNRFFATVPGPTRPA